ncbi:MAG: L-lactate dehydrogenase [Chloroflexaceae bacterium]|nr:L-lactate dehydrogenase [Chloroflexaceae bacterium]
MTTGNRRRRKVGLVGAGMVGSSFAYAFMQRSLAGELIIIDKDRDRAEGEAMDLSHGVPFVRTMRIDAGDYADLHDADVVVIAAGANQRPGQTRLDLLQTNANIIRAITREIITVNRDAVILVATNPVDILTHIAAEEADLRAGQVLGSGTTLDSARFRFLLGEYYKVDPRSVHAYIIGEHGDSSLPVWSLANIAGVRLKDFVGLNGQSYNEAALEQIFEQTRNAAYEIIKRKHATYYAIGLGLVSLVEAILRDQQSVLTVCSPISDMYGVDGISISLPTIVGVHGVEQVLSLPLTDQEIERFQYSASVLKENLAKLS